MSSNEAGLVVEVPGYSGRGLPVPVGSIIRVVDVEGTQIGDIFALAQQDHSEFLSASVTRSVYGRLFPRVGEVFFTNMHRPVLTFLEDRSPGYHDMLFAPCDRQLFEALGVECYHPNCRDNYLAIAAELRITHRIVPDPVNIFQNSPVQLDRSLSIQMTPSQAGDFVTFRAEMDIYFIVTACSCDIGLNNINGGRSTPLAIEVMPNNLEESMKPKIG